MRHSSLTEEIIKNAPSKKQKSNLHLLLTHKPEVYWWLLRYYNCLTCPNCKECYDLPNSNGYDEYGFSFIFCNLVVPPLPRDPDPQPEPEPVFPEEEIGEGEEWRNDPEDSRPIEANPWEQHGPVWWYHSDHVSH
ncbi:hypothetical protein [Myroides odoratus]|uniref:hypothetical protein n=1 Tax=Myroides odoratus TaxID=256 RepID=UPI003340FE76